MVRVVQALFAAMLALSIAPAANAADKRVGPRSDCTGDICKAYKHPKVHVLLPLPCIPIKFDQWKPDAVVATVTYEDGYVWRDSRPFGTVGQFCYGEFRYERFRDHRGFHGKAMEIFLCNGPKDATLTRADIEAGLARARSHKGRFGFYVTLKGSEWQRNHRPGR